MAETAWPVVWPNATEDDDETGHDEAGDDDSDPEVERIIHPLRRAGRPWVGDKVRAGNECPVDHQR